MNKRHIIRLNGFKGVDLTSHPSEVDKSRASYMLNMISDGGINRKRFGYRQLNELHTLSGSCARINGIHKHITKSGNEKVIIHGGNLFFNESGGIITSHAPIKDTPSRLFSVGGVSYIIGCGGIYSYNGTYINYVTPYIPTVIRGYDYRISQEMEWESPNILTDKRKAVYCGASAVEGKSGAFLLPEDMDLTKGVTISIEISSSKNVIKGMAGDTYGGDADVRIANPVTAVFEINEINTEVFKDISCSSFSHNGKTAYLFDENGIPTNKSPILSLSQDGKRLFSFNFDTSPEISGDFNIKLEYYCDYTDDIYKIRDCAFGELIQDNRGKTRFVLSGNPKLKSGAYFSDAFDEKGASYFPLSCFITVDDSSAVTAFMRLSDTYLGVFKKDRFFRYAFYHYPEKENPRDRIFINGYEDRQRVGCINPFVCGKSGSDLAIFDGNGVYGIEEISKETDRSFASLRSINVERALKGHSDKEKDNAVACMHDGRYMLFMGGLVYIADTRYTFRDPSRSDSYQYEWWVWSAPEVTCVLSTGKRLLFGDANGRIYTLGDDYRDISIVKITGEGDALYLSKGVFVINKEIPIDEETYALISGYTEFLKKGDYQLNFDTSTGFLHVSTPYPKLQRAKTGDKLKLLLANGEEHYAYIKEINEEEEFFVLSNKYGEALHGFNPVNTEEMLLFVDKDTELSVVSKDEGYALYYGGEQLFFRDLGLSPEITFIKWKSVSCVYISPMLNLGEGNMTKTLYRIGISTATKKSAGIKFGYETKRSVMGSADGIEGLDFTDFDFDKLSFELPFAKTFEKRVFERNFNYIVFKLSSSANEDCAAKEIYGVYSVNGNIKGVR